MNEWTDLDKMLRYLDALIRANDHGYTCNREIAEVIEAIRSKLGLKESK